MSAKEHLEQCVKWLEATSTYKRLDGTEVTHLSYPHDSKTRLCVVTEAEFWLKMIAYEQATNPEPLKFDKPEFDYTESVD